MKHLKALIILLFLLLIVILAVQNNDQLMQTVTFGLDLKFWSAQTAPMSLYFYSIIVFLLGILIAGIFGALERFRLRREIKTLTKEARHKDQELNSLRTLPVTGEGISTDQTGELP